MSAILWRAAEKITALINSRPNSPQPYEIVDILRDELAPEPKIAGPFSMANLRDLAMIEARFAVGETHPRVECYAWVDHLTDNVLFKVYHLDTRCALACAIIRSVLEKTKGDPKAIKALFTDAWIALAKAVSAPDAPRHIEGCHPCMVPMRDLLPGAN